MTIPSSKPNVTTPLLSKAEIDEASALIQSPENRRTDGDLEKDTSFPTVDSTLTRTGRAWVAVRQLYTRRFLFEMLGMVMTQMGFGLYMGEIDPDLWILLLYCSGTYIFTLFIVGTMIFIFTFIRGSPREPIINDPVKEEDQS
jgi:hypothetical protein